MSKTVTKADIIEHLHKDLGLNKSECKVLVEDFFNEIKTALINNEEVKLSGFGNFELLDKKERPGRNPKTGEIIYVPKKKKIRFRASKKFQEFLNK